MTNDPDFPGVPADATKRPVLPFRWEDLPRYRTDAQGLRDRNARTRWKTQLASGRTIVLSSLEQAETLGGVLCGSPRQPWFNETIVQNAIERVAHGHDVEPAKVVVLPPLLTTVPTPKRPQDPGPAEFDVHHLPPIRSVGVFASGPLQDPNADWSMVVVLWFQDSYGPPTEGHVLEQLKRVDWDRVGRDCGF